MRRTNRSKEASGNASIEGTSARTRPLSFDEIMLKRKKKLAADAWETASDLHKLSVKNDVYHVERDRGDRTLKDLKDTIREVPKKVEVMVSKRDRDKSRSRDKDTKEKSKNSKSSRDIETKSEKQTRNRGATDDYLRADFRREAEKKHSKETTERSKREERDGKSKLEGKRKHQSHTDEKSRTVIDATILKKHDLGKSREREYLDRYERKKDFSESFREEMRSRRRKRSRSHEYDRQRDRSVSLSPRAHKRHYHGQDYEESSSQSYREKSNRNYSDADKYRMAGNGGYASGHQRKQGSGLGGYSPRKRKSEATVKTPSPTRRSPEKKIATWDQPPVGTSNTGSVSLQANFQSPATKMNELVSSDLTVSATKPQSTPTLVIASTGMKASIDSVQLTEATRPMRRLYIENLPPSISDKMVIDCLNDFLLSSGVNHIQGTKPCISCIINKEKCQALVEFITPEDATAALSFDGKTLSGSVIKIRRPKDFVQLATGTPDKTVAVVKAISDIVRDSPYKIFVAGIPKVLSSDMLMEILGAFGVLKAFHFEFNQELNGSCAFLEYVDHSVTPKACAGLNGMKLGGCCLTAVRATPHAHGEEEDEEGAVSYDIPSHAKPLLVEPTQVLQLKHVFTREDFLSFSDSEIDEMLEDIRLECVRFGTVKSVNIVRYEMATNIIEQCPHSDLIKKEMIKGTPESDSKKNICDLPSDDTKEPQGERNGLEGAIINGEPPKDLKEKSYIGTSCGESATVYEQPLLLGEPPVDSDKGVKMKEESSVLEDVLVPELQKQEVDAKLERDSNLNTSVKCEADACHADESKPLVEDTNGGGHGTHDLDVFEPGCVLVEFLRKEAACSAAHCLHGRLYGERVVNVGYIHHDIYRARFLR